ncbi:HAD family hydrolase [Paenibacillus sinopodophylli]|uniref:HAD family hydrolase n=1 Tax=Paenibacillus sinopodophylli TaxID=1837342 RepID=UPI00110D2431|nr:HAD family hydrolase [Paenibacillus sinopodophylli]
MPDLIIHNRAYKVTGILFDKDGTLLDFIAMWGCWSEAVFKAFEQQLHNKGLAFQANLVPRLWGTKHGEDGTITDYDRNGPLAMGSMQDLYAVLAWQSYQAGISWAESMELVQQCKLEADEELERLRPAQPLPDLHALLASCREQGIKLGVVTADDTEAAEKHLAWMGIRDYFDAVVGSDLVALGKPFPDMVHLACEMLSINCSDAAVIGDTNGDMRMGGAAGAAVSIGIHEAAGTKDGQHVLADADETINSYAQLSIRRRSDEG